MGMVSQGTCSLLAGRELWPKVLGKAFRCSKIELKFVAFCFLVTASIVCYKILINKLAELQIVVDSLHSYTQCRHFH